MKKIYRSIENPLNVETEKINPDDIRTGCMIIFKCKRCNNDALYPFRRDIDIIKRKLCKSCVREEQHEGHSKFWHNRTEEQKQKTREKHRSTIMSKSEKELRVWRKRINTTVKNRTDIERKILSKKISDALKNRTEEQKRISSERMSKHSWARKSKKEKIEIIKRRTETFKNRTEEQKQRTREKIKETRKSWSKEKRELVRKHASEAQLRDTPQRRERLKKLSLTRKNFSEKKKREILLKRRKTFSQWTEERKLAYKEKFRKSYFRYLNSLSDDEYADLISKRRIHKNSVSFNNEVFDSTWEAIYYKWCLLKHIKISRNHKHYFTYNILDKIHRYYPDFKIGNNYVEIKGSHFFNKEGQLIDPFTDQLLLEKQECMIKNNITLITDVEKYRKEIECYEKNNGVFIGPIIVNKHKSNECTKR